MICLSRTRTLRAVTLFLAILAIATLVPSRSVGAQAASDSVIRIDLPIGRSYPITTAVAVSKVSVATPEIADVVVIGERDVVINSKTNGETDVILWTTAGTRRHYRVVVRSPADRQMVLLSVKLAEVRKDLLHNFGVNGLYRDNKGNTRAGTGIFRSDDAFNQVPNQITLPTDTRFGTVLSDFGTKQFLAFIDAETQRGNARLLAEPNLLAGNRDSASFLAGGELPIPIAQPGAGGQVTISIQWREFGVRLRFVPEILTDSLIKLDVRPEVSSLDYTNALVLSGFRIPALRTRRATTSVDVRRDQSLIISGLFNDERERVRTGIPFLSDIPVLGALFGSTRWQRNESELLIVVTPTIVDPAHVTGARTIRLLPDTALPARDAIQKRLPEAKKP